MARRVVLTKTLFEPLDQSELTMRIPDRPMIKRLFGDPPLAPEDNEEDYWDLFDFLCREARPLGGLDIPFLLDWATLEWEGRKLKHHKEALIQRELPAYIEKELRSGGYSEDEANQITNRWYNSPKKATTTVDRRLRRIGSSIDQLRSAVIFEEIDLFRALDALSAESHKRRLQIRQELDRSKRQAFDEILIRLELQSRLVPTEGKPIPSEARDPDANREDLAAPFVIEGEPKP